MNSVTLIPFAATPRTDSIQFQVEWERKEQCLCLQFHLSDISTVVVPPHNSPSRKTNLWESTCFEVFLSDGARYLEWNFSPAGDWNVYAFDSYRKHSTRVFDSGTFNAGKCLRGASGLSFFIQLNLDSCSSFLTPDRLGLCAVLQHSDGALSYWAVKHALTKPDFHSKDNFQIRLNSKTAPKA